MPRLRLLLLTLALQTSLAAACFAVEEAAGISVPEGFRATLFADDDLAHDIYSMTLDAEGRVVVAGAGYVKTLHDDDGDGVADRATLFSDVPRSGAHGMAFRGTDLYCTGDLGLLKLSDADGDGKADGEPEVLAQGRHPEHGVNGVVFGADGWIYVICGNDANIFERHVTSPHSPVEHPKTGTIFRVDPKTNMSEVVAHGFRNPYDFAFDAAGRMFTVDADGERDQHLPWYAPNRLFDIGVAQHHGWVLHGWQRSWNRPQSFFDSRARAVEVGRGSPTGVETYRHYAFPEKYNHGVFSQCWTLGRVYFFPLQENGGGYEATQETFLATTGAAGLAPVDMVIGKSGEMYVAIGGRGTRGSVFKIEYVAEQAKRQLPTEPLDQVLTAPQPQMAWSYAEWAPKAKALGREAFVAAALDEHRATAQRVRAIEVITEFLGGLQDGAEVDKLLGAKDDAVAARAIWSVACRRDEVCPPKFYRLTYHQSPRVRRAAWEAIASAAKFDAAVERCNWDSLQDPDRNVRSAALYAAERVLEKQPAAKINVEPSIAAIWTKASVGNATSDEIVAVIHQAVDRLETAKTEHEQEDAIRVVQIALGDITAEQVDPDVYAGYSPGRPRTAPLTMWDQLASKLDPIFPVGKPTVDTEIARTLAMIEQPAPNFVAEVGQFWTEDSTVEEDLHYLFCLSRIPGERSPEVVAAEAKAWLALHEKIADQRMTISQNWSLRVGEAFSAELQQTPQLAAAMLASDNFGMLEHSLFASYFTPEQQTAAATKIVDENDIEDITESWPDAMMPLVDKLPEAERLEVLRIRWDDFNMRHAVLARLGAARKEEDRPRFIESLLSASPQSVLLAAQILAEMPKENVSEDELLAAMKGLRSACMPGQPPEQSAAIAKLLAYWTNDASTNPNDPMGNLAEAYQGWFDWFAAKYPARNKELFAYAADEASWKTRLADVDWASGSAQRGEAIFAARGCKQCHASTGRLGPGLDNITGRFRQFDLFMAIVDPNRDVSPLFHTTQFMTRSGKSFIGTVVYESPAGTLIQTGPGVTERILEDEIVVRRPSRQSMMPVGLLNGVDDQGLADLYAYLQSLRTK
ncbi:c-type cytochrome [Blastopirellula sp. JC732]|uniref:C-type cytochrome n=1 Tax=Blastopirellula sediminis TaxID=2894196 RepID=A0A9X1SDU8_9BACT|nr:PVC-type heme-binding CxxCH protein [Blastopirellula sediminis]MCC9608152.1 c-type cytochrome [Blastopirellula sediminis]MCC9627055.1 c-type cytochrome [Blastopirellula sediminis]